MISIANFRISLKETVKLLKILNLYKDKGPKDVGDYSSAFLKACRTNKHVHIYNTIRENLDYEIVLKDDSFFQFCINDNYLRMSFIENPCFSYSKQDYLKLIFPEIEEEEITDELINELINENEYEQFLNEQEINSNLLYFRYDFDIKGYKPLLHSCAHIHMNLRESLRIPTSKIVTPLQFVCFCIKQAYNDVWNIYHQNHLENNVIVEELKRIKDQNTDIDNGYWQDIEKHELYLI